MRSNSNESGHDADFRPSDEEARDPRRAYDALLGRCPVAKSAVDGSFMITGHAEARACALDAASFSNLTSARLQVPNGLDGDDHRRFRAALDVFFASSRIARLSPAFRAIAEALVRALPRQAPVDAFWEIGVPLAIRCQCTWLGWSLELEDRLRRWIGEYRQVMRGTDAAARAGAAEEFNAIVLEQLRTRRAESAPEPADVTSELLHATVEDPLAPGGRRQLREEEVVSILRNWTAGDLGTIAACTAAVAERVATDTALQAALRANVDREKLLDRAIDECLRIDDPFLWNRRVAIRQVEVGGRVIPPGTKVILNWTAANRDPKRFGNPDEFRPEENAPHNLVYGIGPHACPGRELATLQLREMLAALLRNVPALTLAERLPIRARAPHGGYDHVWVRLG